MPSCFGEKTTPLWEIKSRVDFVFSSTERPSSRGSFLPGNWLTPDGEVSQSSSESGALSHSARSTSLYSLHNTLVLRWNNQVHQSALEALSVEDESAINKGGRIEVRKTHLELAKLTGSEDGSMSILTNANPEFPGRQKFGIKSDPDLLIPLYSHLGLT